MFDDHPTLLHFTILYKEPKPRSAVVEMMVKVNAFCLFLDEFIGESHRDSYFVVQGNAIDENMFAISKKMKGVRLPV
jgi:hypothetical protein